MERYAASLSRLLAGASSPAVIQAPNTFDSLSEAVLADLGDDYDAVVEWQQRPDALPSPAPCDRPTCPSSGRSRNPGAHRVDRQLLAELDDLLRPDPGAAG